MKKATIIALAKNLRLTYNESYKLPKLSTTIITKRFVQNFKPYYFATPSHIFNETHYSRAQKQQASRHVSLEEFERSHANTLDYHLLGLKCMSMGRDEVVNSEIRTHKNPLVIEYTSAQRLHLKAKLFDSSDDAKITNACLVQSDFYAKDYKYCVIVELPEKVFGTLKF